MDSESEGLVEASSARTCQMADRQAQKGLYSGHTLPDCVTSTQMSTGVKHHPKTTQNGYSERSNSPLALPDNGK